MKSFLKLVVFAVPVAFVLAPLRFEWAASLLFAGLFLLVALYDYLHANHMQHEVHPEHHARKNLREWLHLHS